MYMEPFIKKGDYWQWEERRLKNKKEIPQLLEIVWKPSQVAVTHYKGHQRGTDPVSEGNRSADQAAKEVETQQSPTVCPESISKVLSSTRIASIPEIHQGRRSVGFR